MARKCCLCKRAERWDDIAFGGKVIKTKYGLQFVCANCSGDM